MPGALLRGAATLFVTLSLFAGTALAAGQRRAPRDEISSFRFDTLRSAMEDLAERCGNGLPTVELVAELSVLEKRVEEAKAASRSGNPWPERRLGNLAERLTDFKRRALLSNPALKGLRVLCVRRGWKPGVSAGQLFRLGIPSNHECHSSLRPLGYDNEIATFCVADPAATWETLCRPQDGAWIGDPDLHWEGDRLLFSMADAEHWNLWEIRIDGSGMRRFTHTPADVSCFDPCYLPSGRIVCAW